MFHNTKVKGDKGLKDVEVELGNSGSKLPKNSQEERNCRKCCLNSSFLYIHFHDGAEKVLNTLIVILFYVFFWFLLVISVIRMRVK